MEGIGGRATEVECARDKSCYFCRQRAHCSEKRYEIVKNNEVKNSSHLPLGWNLKSEAVEGLQTRERMGTFERQEIWRMMIRPPEDQA